MNDLVLLAKLADGLDSRGEHAAADEVDGLLREAAVWDRLGRFLKRRYDGLLNLFRRRKRDGGEAYGEEAGKALGDMLRRKETGPPAERLFVWFCHRYPTACEPCTSRHGRIRTMRQWQAEGVPGAAVCLRGNCECTLVPMRAGGFAASDGADIAAHSIGLREDGTLENMNQGFSLEPFFSDYGNLQ